MSQNPATITVRTLALIVAALVVIGGLAFVTASLVSAGNQGTGESAGSSPTTSSPSSTPRTSSAAEVAEASVAAASRSAATAAAALQQPGATVNDSLGHSITYYSIQRPAAPNAPDPQSPGTEWVAIDVQVCYGPGAQDWDNHSSWVLIDANNGNYDPSSTGYSQFPSPEFPWGDLTVVDGQCIRGWIVYDVVIGAPIVNVAYMPYGATKPIMWTA